MTTDKPRWLYRFDNYQRAYLLLREAMEIMAMRPLSALEKEGIVRRFKHHWEMTWKILKEYLEQSGVILDVITPQSVIIAATSTKLISDSDIWLQAMMMRNRLTQPYDQTLLNQIITDIRTKYFSVFDKLHEYLMNEACHIKTEN